MIRTLISADTQIIDKRHSGKFISNLTYDVMHITNLLSTFLLNLFKDSLTLIALLSSNVYAKLATSIVIYHNVASSEYNLKNAGKRINKVTTEAQEKSGDLTTYLVELFKNHKLIKIFQKEDYENIKSSKYLSELKEKNKKI